MTYSFLSDVENDVCGLKGCIKPVICGFCFCCNKHCKCNDLSVVDRFMESEEYIKEKIVPKV